MDIAISETNVHHPDQQVLNAYHQLIAEGVIASDPAQEQIVEKLQELSTKLKDYNPSGPWFKRIFGSSKDDLNHMGLYIYGSVGRGKTMLMDLFFEHTPIEKKRRVHFHQFMLRVHEQLHDIRTNQSTEPGQATLIVARSIAKESTLLCFDEMQVTDIADAMILGRLFKALLESGVVVVATSNRPPDDLYKDGLQRDRFLPFIELFKKKLCQIHLDADKDYRREHFEQLDTTYFVGKPKGAKKFIKQIENQFVPTGELEPMKLHVQGREITINRTSNDIAFASFTELCEKPLGAADYIAIAEEFKTLVLENIPQLSPAKRNEAKRFVTLIDALYNHKVNLIATAEAKPEELYPAGDGSFEFERTVSRLIEMQSNEYIHAEHVVRLDGDKDAA